MDLIKQSFIRMSILPNPEGTKPIIKLYNITFAMSLFISETLCLICSTVYFIKFSKIDLVNSLFALMQLTGCICGIYTIVVGYNNRRDFEHLFSKVQAIANDCNYYLKKFLFEMSF